MNCQHHNTLCLDSKIDGIRETCQHCAPGLAVNLHEGQRVLGDAIDENIDGCCKAVTEAGRARLVPLPCF